ncbi:FecR family protein [Winogradskyella flava]|uniref:FecR family protein n=1 Tax=Winogradskyella flava TaxID=1884876 RepID=A0A842IK86_9FLAO|nr:FecR family protein [Winogradskyella flava]MBC2843702.1 FecR family protein [Winogradskyella flava]
MIEDGLLRKWLNDELTDAEKLAFSKREDYALNQDIIEKAKYFKASEFSKMDDFQTFRDIYKTKPKTKSINWIRPLLKIAALVVVSLGVYFTFFGNDLIEERTLASEQTTINLPDLSQVTLNANSEITYDVDSWNSKRRLNLKGEAYFRVAKGKTFAVITEYGIVSVVGTKFNVKARDNYFEVECYEGIVKVTSDTIMRHLLEGDTYRILNNEFSEVEIFDPAPEWINKRSRFRAIPFEEVIYELERQYNIKVVVKGADTGRLFTGGFTHTNLENALSAITQPMNLTFEISSLNQVLIHGNTD